MRSGHDYGAFRITGPADTLAITTTTDRLPIPLDESGENATHVLIQSDDDANETRIRFGDVTVVAVNSDQPIPLYRYPLLVDVRGYSHIAGKTSIGTDTIYVTPVEPTG